MSAIQEDQSSSSQDSDNRLTMRKVRKRSHYEGEPEDLLNKSGATNNSKNLKRSCSVINEDKHSSNSLDPNIKRRLSTKKNVFQFGLKGKKQASLMDLFNLFDTDKAGFIAGVTLIEKAETYQQDMRDIVKFENMMEYVRREMRHSIITEDVFKQLG
jgi:hypothetical protein